MAHRFDIHFGRFIFRSATQLLLRDGRELPIGSRAAALLDRLLQTPGQCVSHQELTIAAWPNTFVDQVNLRVQMSALRRLLDEPGEASAIRNAPGRGYWFAGSVGYAPSARHLYAPARPLTLLGGPLDSAPERRDGSGSLGMFDHGERKFPRASLTASSSRRGWLGLGAELRSHPAGEIPAIMPDQMEITLALSGGGVVQRRGNGERQETAVAPGTLWLCPIGVYEDAIFISAPIDRVAHVMLPASSFAEFSADAASVSIRADSIDYVGGLNDGLIEQMVRAIVAELEEESAGGRLLVESLALSLVARLAQAHSTQAGSHPGHQVVGAISPARLRRVLDCIADEIETDLTVQRLAEVACLSRFHFSRAFKKAVGVSPHQFIAERRLHHAMDLLAGGARTLSDIAYACRFSSQGNFSRAFARAVGMTPGQYRAQTIRR